MHPINAFGSEAQKEKYLPLLATGELIGAFGLTEPDHGSDPGGMVTRARKTDGGYQLSGTKAWITHAPVADVFVIWAKDDTDAIRGFLLERGQAGISTNEYDGKFSLRASATGEIALNDVFVATDMVLPEANGLEAGETIAEITSRLIVNRASMKTKFDEVEAFIDALRAAVAASSP